MTALHAKLSYFGSISVSVQSNPRPPPRRRQRLGEVLEERKAFTVGSSDENKEKNRLDYIVPYDVNRVILAPLPTRPLDTYINASFIQVMTGRRTGL